MNLIDLHGPERKFLSISNSLDKWQKTYYAYAIAGKIHITPSASVNGQRFNLCGRPLPSQDIFYVESNRDSKHKIKDIDLRFNANEGIYFCSRTIGMNCSIRYFRYHAMSGWWCFVHGHARSSHPGKLSRPGIEWKPTALDDEANPSSFHKAITKFPRIDHVDRQNIGKVRLYYGLLWIAFSWCMLGSRDRSGNVP